MSAYQDLPSSFLVPIFATASYQAFWVNSIPFLGVYETNGLEKTSSGHPKRKGHTE